MQVSTRSEAKKRERTIANGAQFVTAHENPAAAMITDAPPTLLAKYVESSRKANVAFEIVQRTERESHGNGRGVTIARRLPAAVEEERRKELLRVSAVWKGAMMEGRRTEVERATIEWNSIARVPARVASSRMSVGAVERSELPQCVWA